MIPGSLDAHKRSLDIFLSGEWLCDSWECDPGSVTFDVTIAFCEGATTRTNWSSMSTTTPNPSNSQNATPIRAITSQIASRSTPTLPPSNQSYEPLIKSLFRGRLRYMLLLSASSTWCAINCWTWWQSGGILWAGPWATIVLLFGPLTLFTTALNWAMVALPVIVLHKVFLTGKWLNYCSTYLR